MMTQTRSRTHLAKLLLVGASAFLVFSCKKSDTKPAPKPPVISYNQKIVSVEVDQAIPNLVPDSSKGGSVTQYSVYPGLPKGISLNQTNGVISGTPTDSLNPTRFVITAYGPAGVGRDTITISVGVVAFTYGSSGSYSFIKGSSALSTTPLSPTVMAGNFKQFFVNPSPTDLTRLTGLTFDMATGKISGTPSVVTNTTNTDVPTPLMLVITGITQDNKAAYDTVYITVNDVAPAGVAYTFRGSFSVGVGMAAYSSSNVPLGPTLEGANPPSTYKRFRLAPGSNPLPTGLHLDSLKGWIGQVTSSATSGYTVDTPTVAAAGSTSVTVRVSNTGGYQDIVVPIVIKATADAPAVNYMMSLYSGDLIDTLCPAISSGGTIYLTKADAVPQSVPTIYLSPQVLAGQIKSSAGYTAPAPAISGMNFNTTSGIYQGTPTAAYVFTPPYAGSTTISNASGVTTNFGLSGIVINTPFFTYSTGGGGNTFNANIYGLAQGRRIDTFTVSTVNGGASPVYTAAQLAPVGGTGVVSYTIYPATTTTQPFSATGLTFNTTTGAISGTPTVTTLSNSNYAFWDYIVVGRQGDNTAPFTIYKIRFKIYDTLANWGQ